MLTEVKHQVEGGLEFVHHGCFGSADFDEVDHILVLQELKDTNFSQGCDGELLGKPGELLKVVLT